LNGGLESAFNLLVAAAQRREAQLYFVSAWQMYLAIAAIRQLHDPIAAIATSNRSAKLTVAPAVARVAIN
jgi:hypothetical protein